LLAILLFASVSLNPKDIRLPTADIALSLVHRLPIVNRIPHRTPDPAVETIIWEVRLPRALAAALIGALLAYAGVAFQGLLMNPLAEPYTVGVSAGAAVGAAVVEVAGLSGLMYGFAGVSAAFTAGIAAIALVYLLARVQGRVAVHTFLLAGTVVGTLLWSAIPLLLVLAGKSDQMSRVMFFIIGSISTVDWDRARLLVPFLLVAGLAMRMSARELNLMAMGEETAAHLGVETEAFKRRVLIVGALATAACVSVAGIIGFVGLVVPHIARRIVGPDHRAVMPLAAILGACLLVVSDTAARVYLDEMPVGVITALVGAPVFCILLRRRQTGVT
jgi:iron complex transport system permease protein